jgi:probable F420-dependent oxidoreductase
MRHRLGLTLPLDRPLAAHAGVIGALEAAGFTDLWTAETAGLDAFAPLAHAAALTSRARLGTGIANVFTRGPALLAMNAAALAEAAPGRFVLGLGAASPAIVRAWNGLPFERPLARVRDTVRFLRAALAGDRIDAQYETFAVRGFRLERPPGQPPPILLAALRPRMLELAAGEADGALLNWLSAADVARAAAIVKRQPGRELGVRILVCPSEDADTVRAAARRLVAGYLTVPAYAEQQRWLGREAALATMWERWNAGDRAGAAAAVSDDVVDALFVHGSPERCAAAIADYVRHGADTPILKLLALDPSCDLLAGALEIAAALDHAP